MHPPKLTRKRILTTIAVGALGLAFILALVGMFDSILRPPIAIPTPEPTPTPTPAPVVTFAPTGLPVASLQPSYVAPAPSPGTHTIVRLNQVNATLKTAGANNEPVSVSLFLTVVPGADLDGAAPVFDLLLSDGSTASVSPDGTKPAFDLTRPTEPGWLTYQVPRGSSKGTLEVRAGSGGPVVLSVAVGWPDLH